MLRCALAIAAKDVRTMSSGGQGLVQAVLLGLLLIFVFSLSRPAGGLVEPQAAAAIFWLASAFGMVLVFNGLYGLEEETGARTGLLLSPAPPHAVWLGKGAAGFLLLLACQIVFVPATAAFLGQDFKGPGWLGPATLLAVDWGLVVLGSLLGALSQGGAARESLLTIILFPLLLPLLLAAVKLTQICLGGGIEADVSGWMGLALAFDGLFTGATIILFPFVYSSEE